MGTDKNYNKNAEISQTIKKTLITELVQEAPYLLQGAWLLETFTLWQIVQF